MTSVYIVTGFLGAGKTTFIKELVGLFKGKKLGLIINEFGREGIDATLLNDMQAYISEINNGSIFCACKADLFEKALFNMLEHKPDVIIVETSGLSNPLMIKNIHYYRKEFAYFKFRGIICVVDSRNLKKVINTALITRNQLEAANIVLLNKTDLVSEADKNETKDFIQNINSKAPIFETSYGIIPPNMVDIISNMEYDSSIYEKAVIQDITKQEYMLYISENTNLDILKNFLEQILPATYRIKGFVKLDEKIYYIDCLNDTLSVTAYENQVEQNKLQKLVVLSGGGLKTYDTLRKAKQDYNDLFEFIN